MSAARIIAALSVAALLPFGAYVAWDAGALTSRVEPLPTPDVLAGHADFQRLEQTTETLRTIAADLRAMAHSDAKEIAQ